MLAEQKHGSEELIKKIDRLAEDIKAVRGIVDHIEGSIYTEASIRTIKNELDVALSNPDRTGTRLGSTPGQ